NRLSPLLQCLNRPWYTSAQMLQGTERRFNPAVSVYRFGDIEVDSSQACLKKSGTEQYIRQQSFHLLLYLLENRQRLISKEELIENFWQDTAVTDNALVQCIADIRKALGDDSRNPRFIKTIPKVGYRFIGTLEQNGADSAQALAKGAKFRRPLFVAAIAALGIVLAIFSVMALRHSAEGRMEVTLPPIPGKKPIAVMYFENQSKRADLAW